MSSTASLRSSEIALSIRGLEKKFGEKTALSGVSLDLRAGECLGLLGPNGAGKTTLVRSIMGRVRLDAGTISVFGAPAGSSEAQTKIAWVPQDLAIYPMLSAEENLSVFGRYSGLQGAKLAEAVEWCLQWSALADRRKDPAKNFSGGMKRRLNMAAGLINRSSMALLDEPTVGVDPQSRERIYAMIEQLRQDGVSIIYTSHYMEEVERLCDRVAIIDHGHIIAQGTARELIAKQFGTHAELSIRILAEADRVAVFASSYAGRLDGELVKFGVADPAADTSRILQAAASAGLRVENVSLRTPGLQELFLELTGKELRE